jgi:hypothetical protein
MSLKVQLPDNHWPIRLWVSLLFIGVKHSSTDLRSAPTFTVSSNPPVDVEESAQSMVSNSNTLVQRCHAYSLRHSTDGDFSFIS